MAVKEKDYIDVNKFHEELNAVKDAINKLGQNLADKMDEQKDYFNEMILQMSTRVTILEEARASDKEAQAEKDRIKDNATWHTRILYAIVGAMASFILNHILTK